MQSLMFFLNGASVMSQRDSFSISAVLFTCNGAQVTRAMTSSAPSTCLLDQIGEFSPAVDDKHQRQRTRGHQLNHTTAFKDQRPAKSTSTASSLTYEVSKKTYLTSRDLSRDQLIFRFVIAKLQFGLVNLVSLVRFAFYSVVFFVEHCNSVIVVFVYYCSIYISSQL